jgi:methanogenic corrinoid protein MtbC1
MADLAQLQQAIEAGDRATAVEITKAAVAEGANPKEVLDAMTAAMDVVGAKFQHGEQ